MPEIPVADVVASSSRPWSKRQPEYRTWASMIRRCCNPNQAAYRSYGGRGIGVAPEWRGRGGFQRFYAFLGPKPSPGHSIDRINNARGYEPGNVRWATVQEQQRNRSSNHWIEANGERLLVVEWAERLKCRPSVISCRLRSGWPPSEAVTRPVRHMKSPGTAVKAPLKGRPRGERNARAKLTAEQAMRVKEAQFGPGLRRRDLARELGVSVSTLKAIRRGKNWAHLNTTAHVAQVIELAERTGGALLGKKEPG